jgi:flagellar basal body-associated protein FliL
MNLSNAASIELYDVTGKLLLVQEIKDEANTIVQVNAFVNGLYLYRVKDAGLKTLATGKVSVHK